MDNGSTVCHIRSTDEGTALDQRGAKLGGIHYTTRDRAYQGAAEGQKIENVARTY